MARSCPWVSPVLFLVLIATSPPASDASVYSQLHTVISLAHSLMARVANLRAARGDLAGSRRARLIAGKLERGLGLGFVGAMWSVSWDFLKNYAWRDMASVELFGIVSDANELLRLLGELTRLESDTERAAWVSRNYQNVLRMSKSLFRRLLAVFQKSGPLRELVVTLQTEFEGDLLRDCLELGAADIKGLVHIFKDIVLQYTSLDKQEL
ncbi:hypothetical protein Nepgr_032089 [Nepenthes gracilis]|uniref:Cyclic nucleotide-binding domain-containing protein n=1 Tax=Nepenthes gracilis TaxID=150966 RepID=A0AAD3TJN6_NEPGR|nr:hypothetical protein Nepgr_032089 [Nepenthes gracilis]